MHPGAPELCNGRDDDCDGVLDDGLTLRDWFADGDADGYGAGQALVACYPPKGYVSNGRDCDDGSALFSPAARDVCDGQDNDCDGVPDGQPGCGGPASLLDRVPGLSVGAQDLNAKYTAATLGACLRGAPGATSETLAPPHWAGLSPDVNGIENAHLAFFQTDRPWDLSPATSALSLTFSLSGTSFVSPQMWDVASFPQPAVVLCDSSGNAKLYLPTKNRLPQPAVSTLLTTIELPLGASAEWTTRTSGAFDPSRVEHLELIVQPLKGEFTYDVTFNFAFSALGFSAPLTAAEDRPAPLEALRRPLLLELVVLVEGAGVGGEPDPGQLRAHVDVHVGPDRVRPVQRRDPQEAELRTAAVVAPDGDLADRAAVDVVRAAALGGHRDRHRLAGEDLDAIRLDQRVDREGAAGVPLAVGAVAAVHEHRVRGQPVADRAAVAGAFEGPCVHRFSGPRRRGRSRAPRSRTSRAAPSAGGSPRARSCRTGSRPPRGAACSRGRGRGSCRRASSSSGPR